MCDNPVFISYVHANQFQVQQLYLALQNAGFTPWMATELKGLKGGEEWKRVIPDVIARASCVLICLSNSLHEHEEGYFHREVHDALERSKRMSPEKVFIIPVRLEPCATPPELANFHCIDLHKDGDILQLERDLSCLPHVPRDVKHYRSGRLQDRVLQLVELIQHVEFTQHDSGHMKFLVDRTSLDRTTVQRYLNGQTTVRLYNLGKIIAAIMSYFQTHPVAAESVKQDLLGIPAIAVGLDQEEYESLAVVDAADLVQKLSRDITGHDLPRIDFRPVADEAIDAYTASDLHQRDLYIPLTARLRDGTNVGHADDRLTAFANGADASFLLLLGDLGTGKTTTLKHFHYLLAEAYKRSPQSSRFPIFLPLREFNKAVNLPMLVYHHFGVVLKIPLERGLSDVQRLWESGRLIFLLDGFDEMAERVTDVEVERNLEQIATLLHPSNRVILTSRTHLFKSEMDVLKAIAKVQPNSKLDAERSLLCLNRFTKDDWNLYLNRVFGEQAESYREKIATLDTYQSLMSHPLLLEMTTQVLPILAHQTKIRRMDLYEEYVRRWIQREEWRSSLQPEQRLRLAEELAWAVFVSNSRFIHFARLQHLTETFFPQIKQGRDIDVLHNEIRTASFLNRNADGDYSFINPAFLFYFQGRVFDKHIEANDPTDVGKQLVDDEVVEILAEMQPDSNTLMEWCSLTWENVRETGLYLKDNARAILTRINPIRADLLGKLEALPRNSDFVSDPILADIANRALPTLLGPAVIRTIDVFQAYVDPWCVDQARCLDWSDSQLQFVMEELAWVLHVHKKEKVTPEFFRLQMSGDPYESLASNRLRSIFMSCLFLKQDEDEYMFRHPYLGDFFLAKTIFNRVKTDQPASVGHDLLSRRVLELLKELEPAHNNLTRWVELTREPSWNRRETGVYIGSNALSLLHLQQASLEEVRLDGVTVPEAELTSVNLGGKFLRGVDLTDAKLVRANLKETDLREANLTRAELKGAILTGADLGGADLSNADLEGAYLRRCNLVDANLSGANLLRASTEDATWGPGRVTGT